jgi:hypothetical protein
LGQLRWLQGNVRQIVFVTFIGFVCFGCQHGGIDEDGWLVVCWFVLWG